MDIFTPCNTGTGTNADLFLPKRVCLNDAWQLSLEKLALVQKQQASLERPSLPGAVLHCGHRACAASFSAAGWAVSVPVLCYLI